jgi:tetratricopeptide (TPR) repeat protein/4-amino-4-deoxy-L-arabinose transferase-like glycosyltransferase
LTSSTPAKNRLVPAWGVFVLLATAFVLKAMVLSQLRNHPLLSPDAGLDTTAYVQLARQVLDGNVGLGPGLYYVSPFYIYFLAAILAVFHSFTAVRAVQIALGTASIGLIFLMARQWFGERAAWIAAALATLTGLFTFYETLILQSSVDVFFTATALWCFLPPEGGSYLRRRAHILAVGAIRDQIPLLFAGVIWGIQTLNRPNVLIAVLGVALVMIVVLRRIRPAAMLVAGLVLGMAPVAIRNVVVTGEWTLVSSHGGLNFYIGNNADATGFYRPVAGVRPAIVGQEIDTRRIATEALGHPATDAEASSYFLGLGLTWMREHPIDAAALFVKKFAFTFHAVHLALPQSYAFFAYDTPGVLRWLFVGPWLLGPLGLVGAGLLLRDLGGPGSTGSRRSGFVVWFSFVPMYAAAVALFFVADRYRLPLMVPLCVCAGGALSYAIDAVRQARIRTLVMPTAAFAVLLGAVNYPVPWIDDGRWTEGLRTAEREVIARRYDEAERWAAWLDAHNPPHPAAGQLGVAQQLMALNEYDRALPYLTRAHQADPNEPHAAYALGQALARLGHAVEAVPLLRSGFEAGIELPNGGEDYARALLNAGDPRSAAAALERIRLPDSADAEAWLRLGRMAMEAKSPGVAEPFFKRAAGMQPGDAATRQQYGLDLLVLDRFEDAARELGEAARLNPRDGDTLSRLAYVEAKIGRTAEARLHAQTALAINPNDPLAQQLAAMLR